MAWMLTDHGTGMEHSFYFLSVLVKWRTWCILKQCFLGLQCGACVKYRIWFSVCVTVSIPQDTEMPRLEWALCCKEPESRARERAEGTALHLSKAPTSSVLRVFCGLCLSSSDQGMEIRKRGTGRWAGGLRRVPEVWTRVTPIILHIAQCLAVSAYWVPRLLAQAE